MRREQILDDAERVWGIVFPGAVGLVPDGFAQDFQLAMDSQASLVTTANSGIPAYLTQWVSSEVLKVLVAPMSAAEIYGERSQGSWTDETAMFTVVERTGEVSSYGDYNNNGSTGVNFNFPQRQNYRFQTITQYGDLEMERAGLAKIGLVGELNEASALVLNKFGNRSYLFGVAGLQNYGMLNDPALPASIQPALKAATSTRVWITSNVITATANEIYGDVQTLYSTLVSQAGGLIQLTMDTPLTLVMAPGSEVALTATNQFNVNVYDLLKKNFPNIKFKTAVEYATAAGNIVQLIADTVEGQKTGFAAFSAKMRAGPVIPDLSSFKQKKSQATWGWIGRQPWAIATMLGV